MYTRSAETNSRILTLSFLSKFIVESSALGQAVVLSTDKSMVNKTPLIDNFAPVEISNWQNTVIYTIVCMMALRTTLIKRLRFIYFIY